MKNLNLLLLATAVIAAATCATAAPVTPEQAMTTAKDHVSQHAPNRIRGGVATTAEPTLALAKLNAMGATDYYVFNTHDGFVIVAGDDRCVPVLGYSDSGEFDPAKVPDGLQYMLDTYAAQVAFLHANPDIAAAGAPAVRESEVKPLLPCNWGQNEPFNRLCPDLDASAGTKCATGCVATAAAQVMYYHKWPTSGEKAYNWDLMLPNYVPGSYTDEQAQEVAQLMADLGDAGGMQYGKTSFTSDFKMMTAMLRDFGYNKAMHYESRSSMTYSEWENMLIAELDAERPVMYSGFTQTGGHSFVIDGYDKQGYFHVNWGWDALSNGYFLICDLSPRAQGTGSFNGGYNGCQQMIRHIYPDKGEPEPENYLRVSVDDFGPENDKKEVALGQPITFAYNNLAASGHGYGFGVGITLAYVLTDVSNTNPKVISYEAKYNVSFGSRNAQGDNRFDVTPPADLATGEYHLHLMYKCPEADINDYRPYDHSADVPGYLIARVADGKMTFTRPDASHQGLRVVKFDLPDKIVDHDFYIAPLTIVNDGEEYADVINIALRSENETEASSRFIQNVSLPRGREVTINLDLSLPRPVGTYYLTLSDVNDRVLYGPRKIITEAPDTYTLVPAGDLTMEREVVTNGMVNATIDVKNAGDKDFEGSIYYRITRGTRSWVTDMTDPVSIAAGETATVDISTPFEGQPGVEYVLQVYTLTTTTEEERAMCIATFRVGTMTAVNDLSADDINISVNGDVLTVTGAKSVAVYSVSGALMGNVNSLRLTRGIYIVVADGNAHKIVVN